MTKLKQYAQSQNTTLYVTLLGAFEVLLHRYTGQNRFFVGSPYHGRDRAEFAVIVGYLANVVVLEARIDGDERFDTFHANLSKSIRDAFEHATFPFGLLVERLLKTREPGVSPLFQVMFACQLTPLEDRDAIGSLALER